MPRRTIAWRLGVPGRRFQRTCQVGARPVPVNTVVLGTPADFAGLTAGDQILYIHGERVAGPASITAILGHLHPGQKVHIVVLRGADQG